MHLASLPPGSGDEVVETNKNINVMENGIQFGELDDRNHPNNPNHTSQDYKNLKKEAKDWWNGLDEEEKDRLEYSPIFHKRLTWGTAMKIKYYANRIR